MSSPDYTFQVNGNLVLCRTILPGSHRSPDLSVVRNPTEWNFATPTRAPSWTTGIGHRSLCLLDAI